MTGIRSGWVEITRSPGSSSPEMFVATLRSEAFDSP